MKRALVTGHLGFVGRHMVPALEAEGWDVLGVDVQEGMDARDFFRMSGAHYDLVIHLAAVVGGRATIEGAPLSVAVDLAIDAEMFGWALRTRPGRVVYFSSSAAYPIEFQGRTSMVKLFESMIDLDNVRTPDLTYGWAKLTGEQLARYARAEGVPVTVLRPFSGYGEGQDLDYPWPSFIDRARRRADPFEIWGDGLQMRDWIHIDDIVGATLACINEGVDGPLNIGTGRATSFFQLKEMVCKTASYNPQVNLHLDAPIGVHRRVADTRALFDVYKPRIQLEDAVERALKKETNV